MLHAELEFRAPTIILASLLICFAPILHAESFESQADRLAASLPSSQLGISVIDYVSGKTIYQHNASLLLKPASTLKLITTAEALRLLGPEFAFSTDVFASAPLASGHVKALYLRAGADPSLDTEKLWQLARRLKAAGLREVDKLVLDGGGSAQALRREGQRAYQAGATPLAFNHNSLGIVVCPAAPGQAALVSLDPREAGFALKGSISTVAKGVGTFSVDELPGQTAWQLGGSIASQSDCQTVYRSVSDPLSYAGRVFVELLKQQGIAVRSGFENGVTGADAIAVDAVISAPLSDILRDLNHYSSNFIAEQILLALGRQAPGRFERSAGIFRLTAYLNGLGFTDSQFVLADASGLSHDNRVTADILTRVLFDMRKYEDLRTEFEYSLSVAARNGTLKQRFQNREPLLLRGKTGTINGVSSLAGLLLSRRGRWLAFALISNGEAGRSAALAFENEFVELMAGDL